MSWLTRTLARICPPPDRADAETLSSLERKMETMSAQLDALSAQVSRNTDVDASAVALLKGLSDQILAMKDDPVAIAKFASDLKSSSDALADAVTANTPAAPTP